jgi:hypothetical protein
MRKAAERVYRGCDGRLGEGRKEEGWLRRLLRVMPLSPGPTLLLGFSHCSVLCSHFQPSLVVVLNELIGNCLRARV